MGNSQSGILFGLIGFNFILLLLVSMAYPLPSNAPNPMNDLGAIGLNIAGSGPGSTGTINAPSAADQIAQANAVNEVCGLSGVGGLATGAVIGFAVGGPIGAVVGGAVGYFGVGAVGCSLAQQNPGAALSVANSLQATPLGVLGDTFQVFGIMMRYITVMAKVFPDTLGMMGAIAIQEPAVGGFLITLSSISAVWFGYSLVKLVRGAGG